MRVVAALCFNAFSTSSISTVASSSEKTTVALSRSGSRRGTQNRKRKGRTVAQEHDVERLYAEAEWAQAKLAEAQERLEHSRRRCWVSYVLVLGTALTVVAKLAMNDTIHRRLLCLPARTPDWLWVLSGLGLAGVLTAVGWSVIHIVNGQRGKPDLWMAAIAVICLIMVGFVNYAIWDAHQVVTTPSCLSGR